MATNPETERVIRDFLDHAGEISDEISAQAEEMLGKVPFLFGYLNERPESFVLNMLGDFYTARPASMDIQTAEIATIAAAAALGADACLKMHIRVALEAGVSRDQILDTLLIAGLIGKTSVLTASLRTLRDVEGER
jgi:4-carboxymuconolactone decarboxylase